MTDITKELIEALRPFARLEIPTKPQGNAGAYSIRFADIQAAKDALSAGPGNTPAERFGAWVSDGPRLAKEAGVYVGISISQVKATQGETK